MKDIGKAQEVTTILKILDGLYYIQSGSFNIGVERLLSEGFTIPDSIDENGEFQKTLSEITTTVDLAFYICLAALESSDRGHLKAVLKSNNFLKLSSGAPIALKAIENYLNGNYQEFQSQLHIIKAHMKYDPIFGDHCSTSVFKKIRFKALQQHVMAYQVIDIKEIAQDFQEPIKLIEADLVALIRNGKLPYKIDQHNKTLHRKMPNPKLNMLKNVMNKGEHYIANSEMYLLRVRLKNQTN